ncbi:tyrosine-type recombinase/integrase [Ktedonospora formicarum]|uniref:tyrosine-type recombinase/integrase n=1 Tax=Ktedonospora formicarum TaxID=2778364 RepID=UPI003B75CCD4
MYDRLLQKADLPHIRIHDLRHSYSTLMVAMKVHGKVVQEILGHSDYRLTMNVYAQVDLAMQEEPARLLDEFFEKVSLHQWKRTKKANWCLDWCQLRGDSS